MNEAENKITVIDDTMGSGKTSFMIAYMNAHPKKSYIYCTPLLSEVTRIRRSCPQLDFKEPIHENGGRKIDSFNNLLSGGHNIVLTHSTFANATLETVQYIKENNYILIMDEVIELLENVNDFEIGVELNNKTAKGKNNVLSIVEQYLSVDNDGVVAWTGKRYGKHWYLNPLVEMADNKSLLLINGCFLVWQFPYHIFELFERVYVLTYLFQGSIMKYYLDYHGIGYTRKSIESKTYCEGEECFTRYRLIEYRQDVEKQKQYGKLVKIWDNPKANNYKCKSLSSTWISRNLSEFKELKPKLYNFFRNEAKAKSEQIMWTCKGEYRKYLKGEGYTFVRRLTAEEKAIYSKNENDERVRTLSCFVPSNTKATNDFKDKSILAYCLNIFPRPEIKCYFQKRKIKFDDDLFALGIMLQWIWRSRIRDDKPIMIYIPSMRMRTMLRDWLDGKQYE